MYIQTDPPVFYRVNRIIAQWIYIKVSEFLTKHKGYSKKRIKHTIQIVSTEDILIKLSGSSFFKNSCERFKL